jgi:hypothetical protein
VVRHRAVRGPAGIAVVGMPGRPAEQNQVSRGERPLEVLTGWDQFAHLDFERTYGTMYTPAYGFEGRNILPQDALRRPREKPWCILINS